MTAAIYNSNILLWEAPSVSFVEIKKVVYKVSKKNPTSFLFFEAIHSVTTFYYATHNFFHIYQNYYSKMF